VPFSVAGAGSPSKTMLLGPRPTSVPSDILIHPTVWPQYTNVTDRQTDRTHRHDRQRSHSIGRTILRTVAQKINSFTDRLFIVLFLSPPLSFPI